MPDDYTSNTQTAGTVTVGGSAAGEVETEGDRDWYAVALEAGRTYRIDLEGSHTEAGTLSDPYLYGVHDADGVLLAGTTNDDSGVGYNSRLAWFTPDAAGTYYIAAGGYVYGDHYSNEGTYTLSVTDVSDDFAAGTGTSGTVAVEGVPDDFAAGTGTSGTVAIGGSTTGDIETAGDRDWFAVTLEAGKTYRIDLEGSRTRAGTLADPYLYGVHDAEGNLISGTPDDDGGWSYNSRVTFTPDAAGTYYIAAGAYRSYLGTYTVSVTEEPVAGESTDLAADTATTGAVEVGGSATGEVEIGGDRDWYAVALEAGRTYRIDLEGSPTGAGTLSDPYLRGVYDAEGNLISGTPDDDGGWSYNSRVTFTPDAAGIYYISAGAYDSVVGTYRVSVTEQPAAEASADLAADTATTGAVAVGGSAAGAIETAGDRDWFAVTLEAGTAYRIDLEGSPTHGGTLPDPYLRGVYDADGNLVPGTPDDDGGQSLNSRLEFTPDASGTYYISAGAYGSAVGAYTLSVTEELASAPQVNEEPVNEERVIAPPVTEETVIPPPADLAADTTTAGAVAVGGSVVSEIETRGDRDWFAVTLEAGKVYRFEIGGSRAGAGTLGSANLFGVFDAAGNLVPGTSDNYGGHLENYSHTFFRPETGGTYYIEAGGSFANTLGTYTVSVAEVPLDDYPADTTTTGVVAVGGSVTGELWPTPDQDWYAVTLTAGTAYRIDLEGRDTGGGTLRNPVLRGVYDADGNLIPGTTNHNGGEGFNSRLEFTPDADGTYYISIDAWNLLLVNHYFFGNGTYRLSVTEVGATEPPAETPADLAADTMTTGAVTVGGSVAGIIETIPDQDWYAVTLEAGTIYRIDLEGGLTGYGTLDTYLRGVYDADGNLIPGTLDDDDGVGRNARLEFTPDADGTYFIAAGTYYTPYTGHGRGTGFYTLSVVETPADLAADTTTTGAVAVDGSVAGEIDTALDRDWFEVTLEAGTTYRIDLKGRDSGDGTLRNPQLYGVHDADGNLVPGTLNDNGGQGYDSRLEFTPDASGTYYISAGAHTFRGEGDPGTYTLSVTRELTSAPQENEEPVNEERLIAPPVNEAPADLAVGGSAAGALETAHDRDWYAVKLEAGTAYRIDLEGWETGGGTLHNPYLRGVYDADGNLIPGTTDDDGGQALNSRLAFTPDEAGTYYIEAGAYSSHIGTYTLSVEEGL